MNFVTLLNLHHRQKSYQDFQNYQNIMELILLGFITFELHLKKEDPYPVNALKQVLSKLSTNLVIEPHVHHQHLPSDADPAGATGVVGVHATPEPHLQTQAHILFKSQRTMAIKSCTTTRRFD